MVRTRRQNTEDNRSTISTNLQESQRMEDNRNTMPTIPEEEPPIVETPVSSNDENLSLKAMLTSIRSELKSMRAEIQQNRNEMTLLQNNLASNTSISRTNINQVRIPSLTSTSQSIPTISQPQYASTYSSCSLMHPSNIVTSSASNVNLCSSSVTSVASTVNQVNQNLINTSTYSSHSLITPIPTTILSDIQLSSTSLRAPPIIPPPPQNANVNSISSSILSNNIHPSRAPGIIYPSTSYQSSLAYLNQSQSATEMYHQVGGETSNNIRIDHLNNYSTQSSIRDLSFGGARRKLHALDEFSGIAKEWPLFESSFHETTVMYQYTDVENILRLRDALKGQAREAVTGLLMFPRNVNEIIKKLKLEFGRPELIIRSQLEEIHKVVAIEEHNIDQHIIKFSNKVANMVTFLESCQGDQHLLNPLLLEELIFKLPLSKRYEWIQFAYTLNRNATIKDFSIWLARVAELIAMLPIDYKKSVKAKVMTIVDNPTNANCSYVKDSANALDVKSEVPKTISKNVKTIVPTPTYTKSTRKCSLCGKEHSLDECERFVELTLIERWNHVKHLRICFCCLLKGHAIFYCRKKIRCGVDSCSRFHNKLLHNYEEKVADLKVNPNKEERDVPKESEGKSAVMKCNLSATNRKVLVKVVPIYLYGPKGRVKVSAFIDEGSQISMLNRKVAQQLGLKGEPLTLQLKWLRDKTIEEQSYVCDLEVSGLTSNSRLQLKDIKVVEDMNLPIQSLDYDNLSTKYKYLKGLPVVNQNEVAPDLLIGLDNLDIFQPTRHVIGQKHEPSAVKTPLGWIIFGPVAYNAEKGENNCYCVFKTHIFSLDDVHNMIFDYFSNDNLGIEARHQQTLQSQDDLKAKHTLIATSRKITDRFETGLLWKNDDICLPDSFAMAKSRLIMIEKKMSLDSAYAEGYIKAVQAFIDKNYAKKLSPAEAKIRSKRTWYLPHFGVINVNKPDKVRLVFDAAARVKGISLNDMLLKGPDQYQPLLAILFRFREGNIGVCADIQEMFPQILIRKEDRDSQRFLWRDGDTKKPINVYEMVAMTFGSKCSPCSAQFIKNLNAMDYVREYPKAVKEIIESHYVDDFVSSFSSESDALKTSQEVKEIHSKGGFNLRGFVSNSIPLCKSLNGDREVAVDMNIGDETRTEKILGMFWETSSDNFTFRFKYNKINKDVLTGKRFPSKRELLALVMSVFDPFGLVANFLVRAKLLLQEVWRSNINWDDVVSDQIAQRWYNIQNLLYQMETMKVPRCYFTYSSDDVNKIELHCFVDSSEVAMAAVCYLKTVYMNGNTSISFVCGKTKCCPTKYMSIPRCELQAAVMGSRLRRSIVEFHRIQISRVIFWSDSQTVLYWIKSEQKKYQQFVANRISEIVDNSDKNEWLWVPTKLNPADEGTRDKSSSLESSHWINGPQWIIDEKNWPEQPKFYETSTTVKELRRVSIQNVLLVNTNLDTIVDFSRFSLYSKLLRSVAWLLRYFSNLKAVVKFESLLTGTLTSNELRSAESWICCQIQQTGFGNEYYCIQEKNPLPRNSNLRRHLPYMDEKNVIRVRGRIDNADILPVFSKRPIILPKKHWVVTLIVKYYHHKHLHQNEDVIICEIRRKFWIDGLRMLVRNFAKNCIKCNMDKAKTYQPLMGQIPRDRLTPFIRPFSFTGLDYFGPVTVKIGRRLEKRWVALFTCLTIRAIHVEISPDLTADSCILCLRNFINFRGVPVRIRTDNGSNLVGARNELIRAKDFYSNIVICEKMSSEGVEWMCNTPLNPAEGGCWERMVRSVKRVLKFALKEKHPKEETLRSFLYDAMNIVNSRPLTHVPVESTDNEPLTPNHFLIGTPNSAQAFLPEGAHVDLRKQWRIVQQMTTTFWKRWVREFLPLLTGRTKWFGDETIRPIKENDFVIICDEKTERNTWHKGIVINLLPDRNGVARKAKIKTNGKILERPVSKLAVINISGSNL